MIGKSGNALGAVLAAALAVTALGACAAPSTTTPAADGTQGGVTATPTPNLVVLPSAPTTTAGASTSAAQGGGNGGGTATVAGVPQCTTVDLSAEANVVAGSAATGHITMNITVTNTSGHTCSLYGFPGLELEDKNRTLSPLR